MIDGFEPERQHSMTRAKRLSRRALLRGVGAAIALPWLEAMGATAALGGPAAGGPCPGAWPFSTCPTACICRTGFLLKPVLSTRCPPRSSRWLLTRMICWS